VIKVSYLLSTLVLWIDVTAVTLRIALFGLVVIVDLFHLKDSGL